MSQKGIKAYSIRDFHSNPLRVVVEIADTNGTTDVSKYLVYFSHRHRQSWFCSTLSIGLIIEPENNRTLIEDIKTHTFIKVQIFSSGGTTALWERMYKLDTNSLTIDESRRQSSGNYTLVCANYYPELFFKLADLVSENQTTVQYTMDGVQTLVGSDTLLRKHSYISQDYPPFINNLTRSTTDRSSRFRSIITILQNIPNKSSDSVTYTIKKVQRDIANVLQYTSNSDINPFRFYCGENGDAIFNCMFEQITKEDENIAFLVTLTDPVLPADLVVKHEDKWSDRYIIKVYDTVKPSFVSHTKTFVHNSKALLELRLNYNSTTFIKTYKLKDIMQKLGKIGQYRFNSDNNDSAIETDRLLRLSSTYSTQQRIACSILNSIYQNATISISSPDVPLTFYSFNDTKIIWCRYKFFILSSHSTPSSQTSNEVYDKYMMLTGWDFEINASSEKPEALMYNHLLTFSTPSLRDKE